MADALAKVKAEFGPDAVILGTRTLEAGPLGSLVQRPRVEITAAPAGQAPARQPKPPSAAAPPSPANAIADVALPFFRKLVENEVADQLAARIVQQASLPFRDRQPAPDALRDAVRRTIAAMIPSGPAESGGGPRRIAFIGPPGAGKTTSIAKLAAHLKLHQRQDVGVISLDAHRLAAMEQLKRYAELIGVPFAGASSDEETRLAFQQGAGPRTWLIDTPGVSAKDSARLARLAALLRAAKPDEIHLTLPAALTPSAQERIAATFAPLRVTHVALTRLDEALGLGVVLNALQKLQWRLSYLTCGQNVPNDIEAASAENIAQALC